MPLKVLMAVPYSAVVLRISSAKLALLITNLTYGSYSVSIFQMLDKFYLIYHR